MTSPTSQRPPVPVLADDSYKRIVIDGVRYYGKHVLLTAAGCNERITEIESVRRFVRSLVDRIDMVAFGETFVERFGSGIEIGLSAVQLIETSAITLHTNDASRDLYLDVFSCKDFDDALVAATVRDWFAPAAIEAETRLRK